MLEIPGTRPRKLPEGINEIGEPYKVLIVDDSSTMRQIIKRALMSEMYSICGEASDGSQAVEMFKNLDPDIVTLDINMPHKDGLQALKEIRQYDKNAKVVMLTSESDRSSVIEAIAFGATGYIAKPPDRATLCNKVKQALNS
jgi:two-component system chemotaxis response regulator CheY